MAGTDLSAGTAPGRDIYTVSRLNREARTLLERGFGTVWLEAELSNFSRPGSGHWYFSLKDSGAQIRCAMFRQRNLLVGLTPKDGQQVLVRGRISLYEPRGDYQLIVEHLEDAGQGALKREFERLKIRLAAEGLFDQGRKRTLPRLPRRIGVITSPSGAAIRDVLQVLARRFPAIPVLIYPVPVQGAQAAAGIIAALQLAADRAECDLIMLVRGGGSLEDLWAFNDEALARQIVASPIPVLTGIGHEVDFTIADFAADVRAPTPSAAAELAVPDAAEFERFFAQRMSRLLQVMTCHLKDLRRQLEFLQRRAALVSPAARLSQRIQQLDDLELRLMRALRQRLSDVNARLLDLQGRLWRASPGQRLQVVRARHAMLSTRMEAAMRARLQAAQARFQPLVRTLHAVSPLATLDRGYAIVTTESGKVLQDAGVVRRGQIIHARLARGRVRARIEDLE
ncbi:MAG: exodeoxyribonuclease VII large subunit [Proteobacteria bacterium]|nr:exodeoxyribonuclease VII large subunit [Pseudomonadota bacterium]